MTGNPRVPLSVDLVRSLRALHDRAWSADVRAAARLHVADTVGIALATRADQLLLGRLLQAMGAGSSGAARVLGGSERLAPPQAAFVNAALAHAMDFDDIHDEARLHPTPVALAATLAAADADAPAERWLAAVALGDELMCRFGQAFPPLGSGPASHWFLTQVLGAAGGALAAGWAMGLDEAQLVSAIGFACMQASGHKEAGFGVGTDARQIYPAFAALAGVLAAQLAASGMVAPATALDGPAGLLRVYLGTEADDRARALLLDTGRWTFLQTSFKPWPCCRLSHPYVAAALDLRQRLGDAGTGGIERLEIGVNSSAEKLCLPLAARIRPATLSDAKYSIPFMTAWALVHGAPSLAALDRRALQDEAVLAVAAKVQVRPGLPDKPGHPPARLRAELAGGQTLEAASDAAPEPSADEVRGKFMLACAHGGFGDAGRLWSRIVEEEPSPRVLFGAWGE